ncbi:dipeptidase [Clostridium sp. 'deep sea']|uniref:dipeptidase n=1 Tax=Clostridium sp. 'deep sea' TaxID=2779445 RepID=UPI0018964578|nr:dipeptidase [Clostridium sp. 'deep sea']QOR36534.1 dipeptidase [Clostridium sp. 'deep sea']
MNISERARNLHFNSFVIDTHCDTLMKVCNSWNARTRKMNNLDAPYDLSKDYDSLHLNIPKMKTGGHNLQFFAVYLEPQYKPFGSLKRTLQGFDAFYEMIENNPEVMLVKSYEDALKAQKANSLAGLLSIEGGEALEGDLSVLRMLYKLGLRCIGLTWNQRNRIAEGVGDCVSGGGLTVFGRELIKEMNRLGVIVDVSHLSEPGFWDVIKYSSKSIIASHSNAKAVCDHARNLTDEQIKALAKNGGVMGMNFCRAFVKSGDTVTIEHMLDHIDHIINLVGPNHIGIGSDFDGIAAAPDGLENVTKFPNLTEGLIRRGHSDETIKKLLGENYLRVMKNTL